MKKTTPRATFLALCSTAVMTTATYSGLTSNFGVNPGLVVEAATGSSQLTPAQANADLANAKAAEKAALKTKNAKLRALAAVKARVVKDRTALKRAEGYFKSHSKSPAAKKGVSKAKALLAKEITLLKSARANEAKANRAYRALVSAVNTAKVAVQQAVAAAKSKAQTAQSAQTYKDGTYTGVGQTSIGAVQVQLTLKADKIVDVKITGYTTHYPISFIDPALPDQLIQVQNPKQLNVVSGATLSTYDFYYAVEDCLQQAKKAEQSA